MKNTFKRKKYKIIIPCALLSIFTVLIYLYTVIPAEKVIYAQTEPIGYVIPSGEAIGVKIYAGGLEVIENNREHKLKKGDLIIAVNGEAISSSEFFTIKLNESGGIVVLTVQRDSETFEQTCTAQQDPVSGGYKLGVWVKDSIAGIGTMTYYDPEHMTFASLGHGISAIDDILMPVGSGNTVLCQITSCDKGTKGEPGELSGVFSNNILGTVTTNSDMGIYGTIENIVLNNDVIPVASKDSVHEGSAYILASIDSSGVQSFDVEIEKVNPDSKNNRGMTIKITDKELLEQTGGIVQGMSGAPIIQDNRLVGAVTHVFVNDPERGYGIFAEYMIELTQ